MATTRRNARVPYVIKPAIDSLVEELRAGWPVLVLQNLGTLGDRTAGFWFCGLDHRSGQETGPHSGPSYVVDL